MGILWVKPVIARQVGIPTGTAEEVGSAKEQSQGPSKARSHKRNSAGHPPGVALAAMRANLHGVTGITPADAGNRELSETETVFVEDHPRGCGEQQSF